MYDTQDVRAGPGQVLRIKFGIGNARFPAFRQCPCLIEDDNVELRCFLEGLATSTHEDAELRCQTGTDEKRGRCGKTDAAGTGDDEDRDCEFESPYS